MIIRIRSLFAAPIVFAAATILMAQVAPVSSLSTTPASDHSDLAATASRTRRGIQAGRASPPNAAAADLSTQGTAVSAEDIVVPQVPPGWYNYDGIRSTVEALPGGRAINTSAFGFYVKNRNASTGLGQNAVGVFGSIVCAVDNTSCWGMNPTLIDSPIGGVVTEGAGRKLIGAEMDFAATSEKTLVQGISLLGSSVSQPAGADGFSCGSLSSDGGKTAKWMHCFVVPDGVARVWGSVGAVATSGANIPSMPMQWVYRNARGVGKAVQTFALNDGFHVRPDNGANGIALVTAPTGGPVSILASGSDRDIGLDLAGQGTSTVSVLSPLVAKRGVQALGILSRAGTSGTYGSNYYNFYWTGSALESYVDTTKRGTVVLQGADAVAVTKPVQVPAYAVAGLPACTSILAGAIAYVTDASGPSYNTPLQGGGSVKTLGLCNGTVWNAH